MVLADRLQFALFPAVACCQDNQPLHFGRPKKDPGWMAKPHGPLSPAATGLGGLTLVAGAPRCHPVGSQRVWRWQRCHHHAPHPPGPSVLLGFVPSITPGVATWACWPHPAALSPSPESGSAFTPRDLKPRLSQGHPEAGSHFGDFFSAAEAELLLGDWRNHKLLLVVSPASGQIPGASRLPKLQNHLWGWQAGPPSITPSPLTRGKSFPTQNASWARAARVHETRKPAAATCLQPSTHPSPS